MNGVWMKVAAIPVRRRIAIFCALLLAIGFAAWFIFPIAHINREAFERIQVGMNLEQVEETIGSPPGNYRAKGRKWVVVQVLSDDAEFGSPYKIFVHWRSNESEKIVRISPAKIVTGKTFCDVRAEPEKPWEMLRRLLFGGRDVAPIHFPMGGDCG